MNLIFLFISLSLTQSYTAPSISLTQPRASTTLSLSPSPVVDSNPPSASVFGNRMRNLAIRRQQSKPKKKASDNFTSNFHIVDTLSDYKDVVAEEEDRIVVVRFHATWCKACKAIGPSFHRLARQYANVKFVDVAITEKNADLHSGLGVPSIPYGHIYHPQGGLVEELAISRKKFWRLERMLGEYDEMECTLEVESVGNPYE